MKDPYQEYLDGFAERHGYLATFQLIFWISVVAMSSTLWVARGARKGWTARLVGWSSGKLLAALKGNCVPNP